MIVPVLLHTVLILMLKIITEITTDISSTTIFCHHFNEMSRIEQWLNTKNGIMRFKLPSSCKLLSRLKWGIAGKKFIII